jgi:hypothetical protein
MRPPDPSMISFGVSGWPAGRPSSAAAVHAHAFMQPARALFPRAEERT